MLYIKDLVCIRINKNTSATGRIFVVERRVSDLIGILEISKSKDYLEISECLCIIWEKLNKKSRIFVEWESLYGNNQDYFHTKSQICLIFWYYDLDDDYSDLPLVDYSLIMVLILIFFISYSSFLVSTNILLYIML